MIETAMDGPELRVLVVDDLADARETMALWLGAMGCKTVTAQDGKAAIEIMNSFRPHLALIDLTMPYMDGFEAARHLKCLKPVPYLVAVSGLSESPVIERCRQAGFDLYSQKPITQATLEQIISAVRACERFGLRDTTKPDDS